MSRPALVIFGPQSNLPSSQYLTDLRDSLLSEPRLSSFVGATDELPALWADLVKYEPSLIAVQGSEFIHELQLWIRDGKALLTSKVWPNTMTMPLTIIIQVVQYFHYLRSEGGDAHSRLLDNAQLGGVQGFCIGFLTAVAVACSRNEKDVALFGGVALRLALCMGAYIDLDGLRNRRMSSVAVRWKTSDGYEKLINFARGFPHAYLSVFRDSTDANITVSKSDVNIVMEQLRTEGFLARETGLEGRCHSTKNTESLQRLIGFIASRHGFNFPPCDHLVVPVRSNNTGKIVIKDPLHEQAMKCVLIDTADWFMVSSLAIESLERGSTIWYFGMIDSIPATIQQKADLKIIKARAMELGRLPESPPTMLTAKNLNSDINTISASERYQYPDHAIAVVGMACKFPGANSVNEFWELLTSGSSMLRQMPSERFQSQGLGRSQSRNPVPFWGNYIDDVDAFDHRFFKISSREAASMDPQQRILLQVAYETMASSGHFGTLSSESDDNIGCYLGVCSSDYNDNIASHPPNAYSSLGSLRAFLSGKISHWFGWTGPSITFDTACSSSAVAIHSACRAIIHGECSQALAGGVSIYTSPYFYQNLSAASFLSPTGATKPFDSQADGYCRGEGAGLVLLKKLSVALADNDKVLGVITGSAINQNLNSTSITVPFGPSQVDLYRKVCDSSRIDPGAVSYVEAHGTGTPVGDPIEFESIRRLFGGPHRASTLRVASVKGNIGHLEGASGVAALIKTLLMIQHGVIPLQANFTILNTRIGALELDKIEIPTVNQRWDASFKAACINNYGAAGSNAALIVCEALSEPNSDLGGLNQHHISNLTRKYPILLAANSSDSLIRYCELLRQQLSDLSSPKTNDRMLASIAFSLASTQNQSLPHKLSSSISTLAELTQLLSTAASGLNLYETPKPKPVVLCFGGQVNNFVALDRGVYNGVVILRHYLDRCDSILRSRGYHSLYPKIFEREIVEDIVQLHNMLFSLQYSCAKAWMDSGLVVDTVVGHSFGQLTALVISGILSFEDGLKLVAGRASLMKQCWGPERGTMISVQADINTINCLLPHVEDNQYEIACYNGTNSHVLVGTKASMDGIQMALTNAASMNHIKWKTLNVTHGFHSVFTEPLLPRLVKLAESLSFNNPKIPIETCSKEVSWKSPGPQSIMEHTRTPVYFGEAVSRIAERLGHCTWIEAGSNSSITNMVSQALPQADVSAHSFQPLKIDTSSSIDILAETTTELWKLGHNIQFWPFHRMQKSDFSLISLPPYQFEKSRHWLPWKESINAATSSASDVSNSCEMLVFVKNNSNYGADYVVNARSDEFQLIVGGHEVLGSPLCPAPLYVELAARSVAMLNQGPASSKHTWSVEELEIKTPLGLSTNGELRLSLEKAMPTSNCYTFVIRSYVPTGENKDSTSSLTHAIGKLNQQPDSTRLLANFNLYNRLIGYQRITSLWAIDDVEVMQGSMVYKAFSKVVKYAKYYQGVKAVCAKEQEVAGKIRIPINNEICFQNTITQPLAIDNFIQVAGIHVNNMSFSEDANVFVCTKIDQIHPSRIYHESSIDSQSWEVYSTYSFNGDREVVNDIFVFNPSNKSLVMIILGAHFTKVLASALAKVLSKINGSAVSNVGSHFQPIMAPLDEILSPSRQTTLANASISYPSAKDPATQSIESTLCQLLSKVMDIPVNAIKEDTTLEELGIDSLMVTEVHAEVCTFFKFDIPGRDFQGLENIKAIKDYLLAKGWSNGSVEATPSHTSGSFEEFDTSPSVVTPMTTEILNGQSSSKSEFIDRKPATLAYAQRAFEEIRYDYNTFTDQTGFTDFFKLVHPTQTKLVLAYIVEAFATLGCDFSEINPGEELTTIVFLPKYELLMAQLKRVLKDGLLVAETDGKLVRTDKSVDEMISGTIFKEIMEKFPQHSSEHQLLRVTGSRLSDCLVGKVDPLRLLLSDKENKKLLEEVYANGPMYKAITMLLGGFLAKAYATATKDEVFHVLEIGGGTGGTTKYIIDFLTSLGRPFTYTFTDISTSLISDAKRRFSDYPFMDFQTLDVEKPGPSNFNGRFHTIISANAVHATKYLTQSLKNIKQMLREDGFVSLVEFTRNIYWFDLVFGLLEGWWRFEDGREHVLANEWLWDSKMRDAGFKHVSWTDGTSEEARTLRIITGFGKEAESGAFKPKLVPLKAETLIETVLIKKIGNCSLYADIYLPSPTETQSKLPIALLIHGGGHVMFTRRNINIPQTKILLSKGFLPVAIDYRFCPELTLLEGPMADCCEAFRWARFELPRIRFKNAPGLLIDGYRIAVIGWSTGGHLAMTVGFTSIQRGLRPPEAILAFYPPTDYEDECWTKPIFPAASLSQPGEEYDLLEGVRDEPISTYFPASNKNFPGGMMTLHDPRWRFVLHMNWKAQMVPVLLHGLPSRSILADTSTNRETYSNLPQPLKKDIVPISPLAQILHGNYQSPTFFVHGTSDDLIPVAQSERAYEALMVRGIKAGIFRLEGGDHLFDFFQDRSVGRRGPVAVEAGYQFLVEIV